MTDAAKLTTHFRRKERMQGAGFDLALPYLLLAPAVLIVLCVLVYPLWDGLKASVMFYRFGKPMAFVGLDNYIQLWSDPQFLNSLWVTVRFVFFAVAFETVLGLGLALFCLREFYGIRLLRTILIIPMVVTPVVVAIVFSLIYASDAGMLTAFSEAMGGGQAQILGDPLRAFIGLVALDVWEWTPLMFLILLAGLAGVPEDQLKAATLLGANAWQRFTTIVLPRMNVIIVIALAIRVIENFKIFDTLYIMTGGGPGVATETISVYIYKITTNDLIWGYVAAIALVILLLLSIAAVFGMKRMAKARQVMP